MEIVNIIFKGKWDITRLEEGRICSCMHSDLFFLGVPLRDRNVCTASTLDDSTATCPRIKNLHSCLHVPKYVITFAIHMAPAEF